MAEKTLTHVDSDGSAKMVDVSDKGVTARKAIAQAVVEMAPATAVAIRDAALSKGDVISVARLAGLMAAKRTAELIPLCHSLPLDHVSVELEIEEGRILITAEARTTGEPLCCSQGRAALTHAEGRFQVPLRPPCFSSNSTPLMRIPRSIALAMS